jgi:pseudouridine synthase
MGEGIRLQKYLANCGVSSRRACEAIIEEGRVSVNGVRVTQLGSRMDPAQDRVTVDGKTVAPPGSPHVTAALHKPRGYVCSASPCDGRSIYELLPGTPPRLVYAGRLDKDSEGLVLLSSDGDLVNRLTHPRYGHTKTYRVTVSGKVTPPVLTRLNAPMVIGGYRTRPARVVAVAPATVPDRLILEFTLSEGRHHQIREMCAQVGLTIHRLVRTQVGNVTLRGLKPGQWRRLTPAEVNALGTTQCAVP